MKWTQKALAAFLAAAMAVTMAAPAFAKTDKNDLRYLDIVDSDGENAYYDRTDTIKPGDKYYIIIGKSTGTDLDNLLDKDLFSFRLKKTNGGKYITGADIVEKRFGSTRYICIEFDAKDNFTDEENKVTLEAIFRAKKDLIATNIADITAALENGTTIFPTFKEYTGSGSVSGGGGVDVNVAKAAWDAAVKAQNEAQAKDDEAAKKVNETKATLDSTPAADDTDLKAKETAKNTAEATLKEKTTAVTNAQTTLDNLKADQTNLQTILTNLTRIGDINNGPLVKLTNISSSLDKIIDAYDSSGNPTLEDLETAITEYNTAHSKSLTYTTITDKASAEAFKTHVGTVQQQWHAEIASLTQTNDSLELKDPSLSSLKREDKTAVGTAKTDIDNKVNAAEAALTTAQGEQATAQTAFDTANTEYQTAKTAYDNANTARTNAQKAYDDAVAAQKQTADALKTAKADTAAKKTAYDNALKGVSGVGYMEKGDELTVEFTVWIQNERQEDDDANFVAGEKGVVIRPVKNETNTITWENSDRTLARLTFQADSDTDYLCPRLSTRWSNEDYYNFFDDQDAYLFDFVSNPDIPAQTRGTLELYNPFLDRDGDYYRDVRDLYLYQVVDGILKEVDFDPVLENDDGEEVLRLRTRVLGTYVVCEDPLDLDDLYSDEDKDDNKKPSRPSDANKPDIIIDANQKPVPNTGR